MVTNVLLMMPGLVARLDHFQRVDTLGIIAVRCVYVPTCGRRRDVRRDRRLQSSMIIGTVFMMLAGSAMHFVYGWSGQEVLVGLFGPVNESIWEHAKLVFWPPLVWYLATALAFRRDRSLNIAGAAAGALWFMSAFQIAFYYIYAALAGRDLFVMDLVDFALTVALGQLLFDRVAVRSHAKMAWRVVAIITILVLAALLCLFTFLPPHLPLFRDPQNGTFGLP